MLAGHFYKLPPQLEAEAYLEATNWINRIPNSTTGASSPHELMTKTCSFLPQYHFGQVGLFYSNDKKQDKRSEWGIFLSYGSNPRYLRAYLPLQNTVVSRRKFVPQSTIPSGISSHDYQVTNGKEQKPTISLPSLTHHHYLPYSLSSPSNRSFSESAVINHLMDSPTRQEGDG
jgi:hypothetical protein